MRSVTLFCSGILALALFAGPAKADPTNATSNTVFAVFDLGGGFDTGKDQYSYNSESWEFETTSLFIVNLATVSGGLTGFTFSFNDINLPEWVDLSEVSYFILGEVDGSEHLILSSNEPGAALDDAFEAGLEDGVRNMDQLAGGLGTPGGFAGVTPGQFAGQFPGGVGTFVNPDPLAIPFGTTLSVGGDSGDLLGFSDPTFLGTIGLDFANGQLITNFQVPEPGLAVLALAGIAGAVIARRRRRAQ